MNNKVYINPNFHIPVRNHSGVINQKMHINPNFAQYARENQNATKIYVNPNFVNTNATTHSNMSAVSNLIQVNSPVPTEVTSQTKQPTMATLSKSRYSLVRHNTNNISKNVVSAKPVATVRISKYKSVSLSNYKKCWDTTKTLEQRNNKPFCPSGRAQKPQLPADKPSSSQYISPQYLQSPGKYFALKGNTGSKYVHKKFNSDASRIFTKLGNNKLKINKLNLKKNNIPCPLFRKYGKCLRSVHGKCDFLHDKKHVTICRKFMKGICHDTNCLLSHDITDKKMPTCFFYLRGVCSRDSCPYLHVKLNDRTKVCPDFLKGYCENGDKCLHRHVGIQGKTNKGLLKRPTKSSKIKTKTVYIRKTVNQGSIGLLEKEEAALPKKTATASSTDSRYYKENIASPSDTIESTEVIKPTRCKLGILPSFIKF